MKIIFDTDLGGDIDDAMALYLALNSSEIDILGITSVYLAGQWRRKLIKRILKAFGREDIPVYIGAQAPLIGSWAKPAMTPVRPDKEEAAAAVSSEPDAVDAIIQMAKENPDAVILAIGPLTNLAMALRRAPWLASTHQAMIMGGDIGSGRPEWNIQCDPEAARIVFESQMDIKLVGLNVTNRCRFTKADVDELMAGEGSSRAALFREMLDEFSRRFDFLPTLHDPLAMAALLDPGWLQFEHRNVKVETRGEFTRGTTVDFGHDEYSTIEVATDVRAEEFVGYMKNILASV